MKVFLKVVAYYRVSTKKQVTSFEVQKETIEAFAKQHNAIVIAEYREIESGGNPDRPEFKKALEHAKYSGAKLVVAKMDRLARCIHFTSGLVQAKVDFTVCDFPEADESMMYQLAIYAQYERKMIRSRTKDALQWKKRHGVLLGSHRPNHWDGATTDGTALRSDRRRHGSITGSRKSALKRSATASEYAVYLRARIADLGEGLTLDEIAEKLNEQGFVSPKGKTIRKSTVSKVLARIA